ncbi:dinitrogenase iron-molybdenum cofactor biosynthesis protein [bacterium]|nr:dinitrogenase iron-molybdenum cofactor biosynthesis protein [bacterium]
MKTMHIAFATDEGKEFIDRHFGDANFYDIYNRCEDGLCFSKRVTNTTEEEEGHADPKKAKGITSILQKSGINIVVSRVFGPNIKRISKKFLCLVVSEGNIEESIDYIISHQEDLLSEMEKETKIVKISLGN